MKLGIIGAMEVEIETLKGLLTDASTCVHGGMTFDSGKLEGLDVVISRCGVGKVNAAMCVQVLCDCFQVTHIVNTGVAGSLCAELDIGDLVISQDAMYHDFDCRPVGYTIGQVPGCDSPWFQADVELAACAMKAAETVYPGHNRMGRVASGDQFVSCREQKQLIVENTGAICTEMEGTAIAHAAWKNGIPFVIIRAISDKADDSAQLDYPTFERIAANRCAAVTQCLAKLLA